jgi:hypothetical protein
VYQEFSSWCTRSSHLGVPGVLIETIKYCKFQLDRDAALGVQGVSKNPIVHFIIQLFLKMIFFKFNFLFRCQWNHILRCEVFMWRHWCYINTSTVWRIAPYCNSIHAPSRHLLSPNDIANANLECKDTTDWLIRKYLSQWPSSLYPGTEVAISQFHKTLLNIRHRSLLDITTDVNSIMKVKEYWFHIPIYHIFSELQFAVSKLMGLDPDPLFVIR